MRTILALALLARRSRPPRSAQRRDARSSAAARSTPRPLLKPGSYADTGRGRRDRVLEGRARQGPGPTRPRDRRHVRDRDRLSRRATTCKGLDHLDYRIDLFTPLREALSDETRMRRMRRPTLEGDSGAGAKTGEAVAPRTLGYEQILGTDYSVGKFPAPGDVVHLAERGRLGDLPGRDPRRAARGARGRGRGHGRAVLGELRRQAARPDGHPRSRPPSRPTDQIFTGDAGAGDPTLTIALVGGLALLGGLGLGALASRLLVRP